MIQSGETDNKKISDKLIAYLREEHEDPNINYSSPMTQLQGGFETAIYQFRLTRFHKEYNKQFVLRLYPRSRGSKSASREYIVQNTMANEGYPVAKAYCLCTDETVLGGAFFIMDFLTGE